MNSSYLSYQPGDYFWKSVEKDFDFSICAQFEDDLKSKHPSFLLTGIVTQDTSCNCPTTAPADTNTPDPNGATTKPRTPAPTDHPVDEYIKQVCYNYIHSKRLIGLQNKTSASQNSFSDNSNEYNKLIRQTVNVTIGILAIIVTIGYS
jgi:hypothetical protein